LTTPNEISISNDADREAAQLNVMHCWASRGPRDVYIGFVLSESDGALECPDDSSYPNSAAAFRRTYAKMYAYAEQGWNLIVSPIRPACAIDLSVDPDAVDDP
jgi:GGDEF domain-containing protein